MYLGESAYGGKVLRRVRGHALELLLRAIELSDLEQRAAKRDPRGKIFGMRDEAGLTDIDRFLKAAGPSELLGELRKRNRRRILLNPASKVLDPRVVGQLLH